MSVDGRAQIRGSTVTVRRPTRVKRVPDDGTYVTSWVTVATGVRLLIQPVTASLLQRIFGQEKVASKLGTGNVTLDIQEQDGLIVTGDPYAGEHYQVNGAQHFTEGPKHLSLALELTLESFT